MVHFLVDQDGVIADWGTGVIKTAIAHYPHIAFPFIKDGFTNWDIEHGLDPEGIEAINIVKNMPGLYANFDPIAGAIKALHEMVSEGHDVSICTSPTKTNPTCASDKLDWLERHVGAGWAERAIITSDKTIAMGDYLIDDKTDISGLYEPVWEHVIFTQDYNKHVNDGRIRLDKWADWRNILQPVDSRILCL